MREGCVVVRIRGTSHILTLVLDRVGQDKGVFSSNGEEVRSVSDRCTATAIRTRYGTLVHTSHTGQVGCESYRFSQDKVSSFVSTVSKGCTLGNLYKGYIVVVTLSVRKLQPVFIVFSGC